MNKNEDNAIAANIAIRQDDVKANPLFTRAYKLCMCFERVQVYVVEVRGAGTARDLVMSIGGGLDSRKPLKTPTP